MTTEIHVSEGFEDRILKRVAIVCDVEVKNGKATILGPSDCYQYDIVRGDSGWVLRNKPLPYIRDDGTVKAA